MRQGLVAALLIGLLAGCSASLSDEGTTQSSNDTEASGTLATSLSINEVAVFQTLKVTLEKDGVAVPASLPILAGRDSLVRTYVTLAPGATAEPVTATLEITDADGHIETTLTDVKTLAASSTEGDLTSTFNFTVPGASLPVGAKLKVALTTATPSATRSASSNARFPADGSRASIGAATSAQHLRIVLVPVHYTFGGADLLPDTTPAQLERDRKTFLSLYPLADVEISVHAPFDFNQEIKANGAGFGQLLRAMLTLRANDNVSGDVYYWGAFQATSTIQEYCPQGCVTGLSGIYGPDAAANGRASVGVGYPGSNSSFTMAHELGHAHGRPHAPCGNVAGPDPGFPHSDGGIGVWGYAPSSQKLIDPSVAKDMMSYCHPQWISDYNYNKLLQRLTYVNHAAETATPPGAFSLKLPYRFVEVSPDGALSFGDSIALTEAPAGEPHDVAFQDAAGKTVAHGDAVFTPYDHIGGGYLLVPDVGVDFKTIRVAGLGQAKR